MTTTSTIQMLTRYNAWANEATFDAVAALPAGEATRERPSLFKNIANTLNHLHVVDLIWQAHIEKRDHGFSALNTVPTSPSSGAPSRSSTLAISVGVTDYLRLMQTKWCALL
jgi:uncharacterized damage-inducible protein DinB